MKDLLAAEEIKALAEQHADPCISITMPTEARGMDSDGNQIRFKNMLRKAEAQLAERGLKPREITELLSEAWHLQKDQLFWKHLSEGFACFIAPGLLRYFRLPAPLAELVTVNRRFHLKPLLELLSLDGRYYVLALSEKETRLLYCTRYGSRRVEVPDMPPNIAHTLRFDEHETTLQQHAASGGPGRPTEIAHGHGGEKDVQLSNRRRYFEEIDRALAPVLRQEQAPLILATVREEHGLFRQVSQYRALAEEFVAGNPELVKDEQLREQAWPIAEASFQRYRQEALARLEESRARGQGLTELDDVVRAAHDGLIDQLFVPAGKTAWGRYDAEARQVERHDQQQPGDDDLLDLACVRTLATGGVCWTVPAEEMPHSAPVAAVLRYPVAAEVVHQQN
jgi:hypothetical protein